ncbi:hypothetical protein QYF61_018580 [Mycteria americana]|uniref:Uncharacterized protein n=1 Tax=Mycteria americana TaxID=33587 RepID=A0AAN7PJY7_MYCAM|nr:hypothetical protein QYF61_018580 [Mycteria americana]
MAALISRNAINTPPDATPCRRVNQQGRAALPKCKALPQAPSAICSSDACGVQGVTAEPSGSAKAGVNIRGDGVHVFCKAFDTVPHNTPASKLERHIFMMVGVLDG